MIKIKPLDWYTSPELVPYELALQSMEDHVAQMVAGDAGEKIWLLEHPPIYTTGTSAKENELVSIGDIPVFQAGRGGQTTYHGPGQRVAYVMLNLKERFAPKLPDIRQFVFNLEEWVITTLAHFGVKGERREGRVGVWVVMPNGSEAKIAAIGIRIRRYMSFHGISINVDPDLSHYQGIIPCGISQYGVTSLKDLGIDVSMDEVDKVLKDAFKKVFG